MEDFEETIEEVQIEIGELTSQSVFWRYEELLELLVLNTGIDKPISIEKDEYIGSTWGRAIETIAQLGFPQLSLQVADILYGLQLEAQNTLQKRLHKGVALQVTGETYFQLRRYSLAKKYYQLALIEDAITHRSNIASKMPAGEALTRDFAIPFTEVEQLIKFTLQNISEVGEPHHPEKIYTDFLISDVKPKTRDIERDIFRINTIFARELFEQAINGTTQKEKGDTLEHLSTYLFSCIDGFEIVGQKQYTKDYEIDILIRNTITQDPILADFGPYILVECKNWGNSIGTEQVNHFLSKLQFHDCRCGVIIAKDGISGYGQNEEDQRNDRRYANLTILKAFHRNGIIVMVLNHNDLEKIVTGQNNILSILISEYERIRFDKSSR